MRLVKIAIILMVISSSVLRFPGGIKSAWTQCDIFSVPCDWVGEMAGCGAEGHIGCGPGEGGCYCDNCPCIGCTWSYCECCGCSSPPCSKCFTGETEIEVKETKGTEEIYETKEIKELEPGDVVSSFDPETGLIKEDTVSGIQKHTREGYFELETESGKKAKVTGEHPFLAVKSQESGVKSQELITKVKDVLSNTLTYRLITNLQAKIGEILH